MVPLDLRVHNILDKNRQTLVMAVQAVTEEPLEMQELLVLQAVTAAPIVGATVHQVQVVVPQVEL
jgi:putative N-acetylmannosamine-6-phosphate epimerase